MLSPWHDKPSHIKQNWNLDRWREDADFAVRAMGEQGSAAAAERRIVTGKTSEAAPPISVMNSRRNRDELRELRYFRLAYTPSAAT